MKKRFKQILAILVVAVIAILYTATLTLALLGKDYHDMFLVSLYATVCLPVFLYIVLWLKKVLKDRAD